MIAGVVSYMLLCRGGVVNVGLVSLTSSSYPSHYSPYSLSCQNLKMAAIGRNI